MLISVYYQSGKVENFDSVNFTRADPFGNLGTSIWADFNVRYDLIEKQGLVVDLFWYDSTEKSAASVTDDETGATLKELVRKPCGRALLVDKSELGQIAKITQDGQLVAWRQGTSLINGIRFSSQEILCFSDSTTSSINKRASSVYAYLRAANPEVDDRYICDMMGFPPEIMEMILADEAAAIEDDDWDE